MKKIMIVDDDEKIVFALSIRLKSQGYEVMTALDPAIGYSKILENKPDLVVLDINMPAGGGLAMAERIIQKETLKNIPIIVISASSKAEYKEKAKTLGVKFYLEKPFDAQELLNTVAVCLKEAEAKG